MGHPEQVIGSTAPQCQPTTPAASEAPVPCVFAAVPTCVLRSAWTPNDAWTPQPGRHQSGSQQVRTHAVTDSSFLLIVRGPHARSFISRFSMYTKWPRSHGRPTWVAALECHIKRSLPHNRALASATRRVLSPRGVLVAHTPQAKQKTRSLANLWLTRGTYPQRLGLSACEMPLADILPQKRLFCKMA